MKKLVLSLLFITSLFAQNYKKVEVQIFSKQDIIELKKIGIVDANPIFTKDKQSIEAFVDETQFEKLQELGFSYNILIEDWQKYYQMQAKMSESEKEEALNNTRIKFGVTGFDYGSMGGFLTADEVYAKLDEMYANYPDIISQKYSIGNTLEGRPMYAVKISDNPNVDEEESEVFYNALIHAREPEAMMQMIYFMYYLLENYGTNDEVTYLVDNREMFFLPVFNVDGYTYNQTTNPSGGGMWRKNRSTNSDGSRGVDLNRNWGFEWGYNNTGSSGSPSDGTYRGPAPFSEPATENVRQFCNSRNFVTALNYHTYSNLLIIPWGYIDEQVPDSDIYWEYAADMTQFNGYTWGISSDIIYEVNGAADDWMYGEQTEKNKIISMTPEVGSSSDGFWPPQSRILPLAEENVYPNLYLAWVAGEYVEVLDVMFDREYINPGDITKATVKIKNKGLGNAQSVVVNFASLSDYLSINGRPIIINDLAPRDFVVSTDSLQLTISETAPIGEKINLESTVQINGITVVVDTLSFIVGTPDIIFEDTSSVIETFWSLSSNTSVKWDEITSDFVSSPNSYTDSKYGDYGSDLTNKMYLTNSIDLTDATQPFLTFAAKWDIEAGWDCARVSISTNGGTYWTDIEGLYTKQANGQGEQVPSGAPIYDGVKSDWVNEMMDLSDFVGEQIKIRFMIESDSYVEGDGFYVDDIKVWQYAEDQTDVELVDGIPTEFKLEQNYPNPFSTKSTNGGGTGNPSTTIKFSIPQMVNGQSSMVSLKVYDVLGKEIAILVNEQKPSGNYVVTFDASKLTSGVYFYRISVGNFVDTKKMILLK